MRTARRYAGLTSIVLALSASAAACTQHDDVVVSVQKETVDAGTVMTGSGGMTAAGTGGMTAGTAGIAAGTGGAQSPPRCMLPDWVDEAVRLGSAETGCRIPHNDPLVMYVENLYQERMAMGEKAVPISEGDDVTHCEVDLNNTMNNTWMWPYYQDAAYPDDYTLCPFWCGVARVNAAAAVAQFRQCMNGMMMP